MKNFVKRFRFYFQYFPFTVNTILFAIACWAIYTLAYREPADSQAPVSSFVPFIMLMLRLAFSFVIAVIALSVVSTLFSWLYFIWLYRRKKSALHIEFTSEEKKTAQNKLYLKATLQKALRPILGFVKGRLFYDNYEMTDFYSLLSGHLKEKSFWRAAITGKNRLRLPDIKEYELKGSFIYFQDMLHLVSLAVKQPLQGHFYQPPHLTHQEEMTVFPKKTENTDVRIEELRRVEGEPFNYKDFEAGDDVRRIVWKVYAKNRDLVVKIPERFEPYASHLYFYASFFADVRSQWLHDSYLKEMLNYYKNHVWTIYHTLSQKEWEMRYIPEQELSMAATVDNFQKNARIISNSRWQKTIPLSSYYHPKKAAVLCISSFMNIDDLQNALHATDNSTVIYFVKCSQAFKHFAAWGLLKRFILLPPKDRLNQLRGSWVFSPMKYQIIKKEKEIEALLSKTDITYTFL